MDNKTLLTLILQRLYSSDEGTVGILSCGIFILELPERDNEKQYSRIPATEETEEGKKYLCQWKKSPRFGFCYQVTAVPNRGNILVHAGNVAGDVRKGFLSHSHGCLLPFLKVGKMNGQLAGFLSSLALKKLYEITERKDFYLEIKNEIKEENQNA